ncbi:hypothetical protein CRENBAI_020970 [Crenichthys baileyi]|uniref:Ig-like domain-containing protein n=1 Tax=Crenichthys baileyi TaxID=28760 RepID=A0AAV9R9D4_9TELE
MAQWQQKKRNSHQITFSITMFSVALLLLLLAGSCVKCEQLTQPPKQIVQPGQHLTISCQVSYSLGSYSTHWIRQAAGKQLEWIGGARSGVKCEQLTQPGQRLTIRCQVPYHLGYYTAWIRQAAGKGLEWIGMKYTGGSYYKDSLKNKFSIELDTPSNTVTLNGQNLQPEDSAVYYCARDPQ